MSAPMSFEAWSSKQPLRDSIKHDENALEAWEARQPEIDALKARIAELEQENFRLAAGQCVHPNGIIGSDGGAPLCPITCTTDADSKNVTALKGQS